MGVVISLVGGFGAGMAFIGSVLALFSGGMGVSVGAGSSGSATGLAVLAILASLLGGAGAVVARWRLRTGGALLIVSAMVGVLTVAWFYMVGAVLLLVSGGMAFWGARHPEASR